MAEISLKIKSDFDQAAADFKKLGTVSESTRMQMEKFQKSFSTDQIDKFMDRNRLNSIAIRATQGATAALASEAKGLQREMERLIKRGMDPQDVAMQKLIKEYDRLQGEIAQTSSKSAGAVLSFQKLNSIFIAGYNLSGALIAGLGKVWGSMVEGASSLTEVQNVVDGTFGESAGTINEWSKTAISAFGLSELQAKKFTGTFGAMIKSSGITGDAMTEMSTAVVGLAGDFASFYNLDAEDAFNKIRSGISGETEPLKQLGINMSVANLQAYALTQGITKQWGAMTQAEQVQLRYNYLMNQSKDAQGDFAKTLETSYANQKRVLSVKFNQAMANLGVKILPILTAGLKSVNENMDLILVTISALMAAFSAYMIVTKGYVAVTILMTAAQAALNFVLTLNPIGLVIAAIAALIVVGVSLYKNWDVVKVKMLGIWDAIKTGAAVAWEKIKIGAMYSIKGIIEAIMWINKPFVFVIDNIIKAFNKLTGKEIPTMSQAVGKFTDSIDKSIEKSNKKIEALHAARMKQIDEQAKKENQIKDLSKAEQKQRQKELDNQNKVNQQKIASDRAVIDHFQESLKSMANYEKNIYTERLSSAQDFFSKQMESEKIHGEDIIAWQQEQSKLIAENTRMTFDEKEIAMAALSESVKQRQASDMKNFAQFGAQIASYGEQMFSDLATTMENAGVKSKAFAVGMKIMSAAQAGINSYLAFTQVLADATIWPSWLRLPLAGTILAAGLAKQAAIWSTPLAETGMSDYVVPEIRGNRNDGAAVMAQAGEHVSVTPRGEESSGITAINISIAETQLFSIISRGIKTGRIDLNNKNVGRGVFAN